MFLIIVSFMGTIVFFLSNFSEIGYINRCLSLSNRKKVNVRKLKKIIYIPHYGKKTGGGCQYGDNPLLGEKKFDGSVYKTTLILTLVNYFIMLLNIVFDIIAFATGLEWMALIAVSISILYTLILFPIRDRLDRS